MIVCICEGVSSREIEDAVHDGACTIEEISVKCSAGQGCGACHEQILEIIGLQKNVAHVKPCDISVPCSGDKPEFLNRRDS